MLIRKSNHCIFDILLKLNSYKNLNGLINKICKISLCVFIHLMYAVYALANGNIVVECFVDAKKFLEEEVYFDHRITIYCGANFDETKRICLPDGFVTPKYERRAERVEWEHMVPAENFGRVFVEWREGGPLCINKNGTRFRGRKCATMSSQEYRFMEADMYNLYPAIGAVNAIRSNCNFQILDQSLPSTFGVCLMKINGNKVEPPEHVRGIIARTYKYMEYAYPKYKMSKQQKKLMDAWDKMYPVDEWECTRTKRIEAIQGNENPFVKNKCIDREFW